jgi:VanZ family protein
LTNSLHTLAKSRQLRAFLWWALTIAWAALIFDLSTGQFGSQFSVWLLKEILAFLDIHLSLRGFLILHFGLRKLAHLTEYAILSALLYGCLDNDRPIAWRARTALWCILIAGAYSLSDEFHQVFVPGRTASLVDCGIDTTGASLGMLAVYGNGRFFQAKSKRPAAAKETAAEK